MLLLLLSNLEAMEAAPPADYLTKVSTVLKSIYQFPFLMSSLQLHFRLTVGYFGQMPLYILWQILLRVVSDDGDMAFIRLSLTCKLFRDIANETKFREEAHFMWLDRKLFNANM